MFPTLGTFLWYLATGVFYTATEYSAKYCILEIPSNILYPIEYSYDYTEVPAGYPPFSIAYLIYSTLHVRTSTAHRWRSSKKMLTHSTRKNKSNHLEPHFQTSATKSWCLEDIIYFPTSSTYTKRMLGREKVARHVVYDIF